MLCTVRFQEGDSVWEEKRKEGNVLSKNRRI